MPQNTRSSLTVDTSNLYSLNSYSPGVDGFLMTLAVLAFVLLFFTFGTQQSIWMPMYDFMQGVMVLVLVNATFPPNLLYSIRASFASALTFLPNFFDSSFTTAAFSKKSSNNNIYSLMQDGAFLRVLGCLYFVLLMLVIFLLFALLLSKKSPNKEIKKWSKSFLREYFWRKHLHGLVYLFFLPVFLLGIFDMRIYAYLGTAPVQIFSIISSYVFMLVALVFALHALYRLRCIVKDYPVAYLMMQKAYNFILLQKTVLV
jgi:hypothetical protein